MNHGLVLSPELIPALSEIARRYGALLLADLLPILGAAGIALLAIWWYRKYSAFFLGHRRLIHAAVVLCSMAVGLALALHQATLVDDAFISFRYARNLVEGHGLVFNLGERVEGYTNFLWTMLIAAGMRLFPLDAAWQALFLGLACFVVNLRVVDEIGRRLHATEKTVLYLPLAVVLLGTSRVFTAYATTGLETMAASLLVNFGLLFLLTAKNRRDWALSGLMFFLAVMTRPDQLIFLAAAIPAVLFGWTARPEARRRRAYFFSALPGYLVYLAWKFHYYGSIIPNTFYPRRPIVPFFAHGVTYLAVFYSATQFWLIAGLFLIWLASPGRGGEVKGLKSFAVIAFVLTNLYVTYFGGDWMHGRFLITLMPIVLLGMENFCYQLARRERDAARKWRSVAVAVIAFSTIGVSAQYARQIFGDFGEWRTIQELGRWHEWRVDPLHLRDDDAWFRRGATLKALFTDRGLLPVVQLGAIGAVGYLTRLPIADSNLLVQRDPSRKDVRSPEPGLSILVGHSTFPSPEFLRSQRIDFLEGPLPPEFRTVWRRTTDGQLAVYQYNPEVMTLVRKHAPELGIIDFVAFLDDYLANLNKKSTAQVARDFEAFKDFYFVRGRDPRRRLIFESYLAAPGR